MRLLSSELYVAHCQYLRAVREFFFQRDFLEVETPLLNACGTVEAHLDSLEVRRHGIRKSPQAPGPAPDAAPGAGGARAGYLVTSPEYNMKILLSELRRSIFQIAHVFREGDLGQIHSEEFLMLEWYLVGADESALMQQCEELLRHLAEQSFSRIELAKAAFPRRPVSELLQTYAGCPDFSRESLSRALRDRGLASSEDLSRLAYDDLFYTLYLNQVEAHLGLAGPEFVYDYPPELAALSRIEDGRARRFEIYWKNVELANGYYELIDAREQKERFAAENRTRRALGKIEMMADPELLAALDRGLPECSGIALGVDRLFMLLRNGTSLAEISAYDNDHHANRDQSP